MAKSGRLLKIEADRQGRLVEKPVELLEGDLPGIFHVGEGRRQREVSLEFGEPVESVGVGQYVFEVGSRRYEAKLKPYEPALSGAEKSEIELIRQSIPDEA